VRQLEQSDIYCYKLSYQYNQYQLGVFLGSLLLADLLRKQMTATLQTQAVEDNLTIGLYQLRCSLCDTNPNSLITNIVLKQTQIAN